MIAFKKNSILANTTLVVMLTVSARIAAAQAVTSGGYRKVVGANTETEAAADEPAQAGAAGKGFSISVDGERLAGDNPTRVDAERKTDVGLEEVDIQVKFDGLDQKPMLNVSTVDGRRTYRAGALVKFLATSNYRDWLSREEVLIYPHPDSPRDKEPLPIVVPIGPAGRAQWTMPEEGPGKFEYVLRVYDRDGRFDETVPLSLARTERDLESHVKDPAQIVVPGSGDDRTALRNIPVYGGAVTVYGRNVPPGYQVKALGEYVPVDKNNTFVIQHILPPGDHVIDVAIHGDGRGKDSGLKFDREINIPSNDWFYLGLADFTVGHRFGDGSLEAANPGEYDKTYTKGRAAFYLKGKIKGKYLLTAAADTRKDKVENLFRGFDAKDARNFLARINPEEFYPIYGDDATAFEDAPTRGKFYVRLERGESRVMWGNFKARVSGSKFLRNERSLYGANAVYKSESKTSFGESRVEVEGYAANAETLPQRDVLRGTAGSAYFLKYQDIIAGSEVISVQTRSKTGRVIETKRFTAGVDYEINYLQGVIILKSPLPSGGSDGDPVKASSNDVEYYLVAQYERTPTVDEVDGSSFAGRAHGWVGDHVRFGVTGMKEEAGEADQQMMGADLVVRRSDTTYLEAEVAQTEGPWFGKSWSTDGGNDYDDIPGTAGKKARAYSVRGQVDLADVSSGRMQGTVGGYYEDKEAGFSSLDYDVIADQRVWRTFANVAVNEKLSLSIDYEDYSDVASQQTREGTANSEYQINEYWKASFGIRYVDVNNVRKDQTDDRRTGDRADIGARLTYLPNADTSVYVFGQGTVTRSGELKRNDRIGLGGETRLTDRIGVGAEVSYGTLGWGALAAITYDPTVDRSYYLGYRLNPEEEYDIRNYGNYFDTDDGSIVLGLRHRYSDVLSTFSEANTDIFGNRKSLTTTYGVTYTPDTLWTATAGFEAGRIRDENRDKGGKDLADFERMAPSFGISYKDEDRFAAKFRALARFENSDDPANSRDQTSYYFAGGIAVKTSEDWRLLANIDAVLSKSNGASIRGGEYIEGSLGAAYRPVADDRFNALFKYVYLQDVPSVNQVSAVTGDKAGPKQRSHILSVDGTYDVNRYLSIGAKYGFRIGETSFRDKTKYGSWIGSTAHLGVLRADFHVVRNWDLLAEARVLYTKSAGTDDLYLGALAAVYRHFGDNMKAGVGYNFGTFSDDLRDQTFDNQGVFLNVIGKF